MITELTKKLDRNKTLNLFNKKTVWSANSRLVKIGVLGLPQVGLVQEI
jgi:hypothetical protein